MMAVAFDRIWQRHGAEEMVVFKADWALEMKNRKIFHD
jgi:hypothetical protein